MDDDRFDRLAMALAALRSRRGTLRLLSRGALAPLGLGLIAESEAKKRKRKHKKKKKTCKKGKKRCGKKCVDLDSDSKHCGKCGKECEPDQKCIEGVCFTPCAPVCGTGGGDPEVCCFGFCANLTTDATNCGQCGHVCAQNEVCRFANCTCDGPRCPLPGSDATRCCPAADGVCCASGGCCPAGEVCTEDGRCCPPGNYSCGNGFCCPIGLICSGFSCLEP